MQQLRIGTIVLAAAVAVTSLAGGRAIAGTGAPAASQGKQGWGTAEEVPGTAALNESGKADITSVSCGAAGNCSAGGWYRDSSYNDQAFLVSQVNGTWGTAIRVPGTVAGNKHGDAGVTSVSCTSAGNCSAGGWYFNGHTGDPQQAFVVSQVNGTWGAAIEVPAPGVGNAGVTSMSCISAGNCSAGGWYQNTAGQQVFVVSEVNGTWGTAIEVPGTAALNHDGNASITSVSCASAGNCSAGGYYHGPRHYRAFVVSEVNGTWRTAVTLHGTAAVDKLSRAGLTSVSCVSAGNCSAGGWYRYGSAHQQAFVVSEVNGAWGTAIEVPGIAGLDQGHGVITSLSCASAAHCSAGGTYSDSSGNGQVFVAGRT
jgi:hypothetical protein